MKCDLSLIVWMYFKLGLLAERKSCNCEKFKIKKVGKRARKIYKDTDSEDGSDEEEHDDTGASGEGSGAMADNRSTCGRYGLRNRRNRQAFGAKSKKYLDTCKTCLQ